LKSKKHFFVAGSSKMVLPYIAFFWDIENCQVPNNKNAGQIVKFLRAMFADGEKRRRERDFMVVCDINKEHPQTINQLNQEHVSLFCKKIFFVKVKKFQICNSALFSFSFSFPYFYLF
jgi:hypothetical protein